MEEHSTRATAEAETETHINAKGTGIQTKLRPHQERRGSDVIDSIGEESVFTESRRRSTSKTLNIHVEFQSTQRRSSDVVDYIGDKHSEVNDKETKITEVDKAVGGAERPTTLDMKPTVSMEWNQEEQAWASDDRSSKDVTDATPSTPLEANSSYKDDSRCIAVEADMPVDWNADEYNMQHKRRGHAVIFNHDMFETRNYAPREGSHIDVENLREAFSSLLFDVTIHNNLEYSKIKKVITALAEEDHSDADCIAVIVLTHGEENGLLVPRDSSIFYSVDILWKPFTADKCPTLAGKPKLFFIQACRGRELDAGIKMKQQRGTRTEFDSSPSPYKIPTHADFLIAYSTMEGFYSFRNLDTGTWFIQSLCKELNSTDNLLQILTRTTRRVTQLESDSNVKQFHKQKQVPSITSMLTRDLHFHPKS